MISALSMSCRYTEVMPRLLWPSWRWMTSSGTAVAREFDGMGMAELVRGEAAPGARLHGAPAQRGSGGGA